MKSKITLIVFFLFIPYLTGCVPAVLVAGGAATGAIIYDQRKAKVMVSDRDTTFGIQKSIDHNAELRNKVNISVATFNNVVLLVGQAPTAKLRRTAEAIAKSHPKVKMIYNEITIRKPISKMARANDSWITTKVKTVLVSTAGLKSSSLKIVTENRVVYLMGLTTRAQAKRVAEKARTIAGVKKVVKIFEYINSGKV